MTTCDDCASCLGRPELARGLGRSVPEVERLAARCSGCGHRLHRHLHGSLRSRPGGREALGVQLEVDPPPRASPLGQLLIELGEYDDYHGCLGQ